MCATVDEQRDYLLRLMEGYARVTAGGNRGLKTLQSDAEKLAFDQLMQDANRHRKRHRPCGMIHWYALLLRGAP